MPTTVVNISSQVQGERRARYLPFFFAVLSIILSTAGRGDAASVSVAPSLTASQTQQFTATVTGTGNAGVTWSLSPAVGTISGTGLYIAPAAIASAQNVTVKATSTADPTQSASSTISLIPVTILLNPSKTSLTASQTQQFTTTVTGTANTGVTWSVSPALGTISSNGLYIAPASIASAQVVTVKATSTADPTKSASSTISLIPVTISLTPSTTSLTASQTQQFTTTVTGTVNTGVTWSLSPAVGTISVAGLYTAPPTIAAAQTVTVKTTSVADPTKSASATVTLNPPVNVTVAPPSVTLTQSQTQTFSATVTNTGNTAVTWSLSPVVGSITAAGLYTAPTSITSSQTVTVKATSVADPTKSATATVTLTQLVTVSLTPSSVSLLPSQNQTFTATVSATSNTAVTWSINPALGGLVSSATTAVYVAPSTAPTTQSVTITATSMADPSKTATAVIILLQAVTVSLSPSTVSLAPSGTQQFTATVLGTSNTAVTWSINPSVGTISSTGLYTAPSSILTSQTVTVTALSAADPTKSVSAQIHLSTPVSPDSFWRMAEHTPYNNGSPVSAIPWASVTHVSQVGYAPQSDGTLADFTAGDTASLISAAHSNGVKVLASVADALGGDFNGAVTNHLSTFVTNIMSIVTTNGYDGVEIDWEASWDVTKSTSLISSLRTALGSKLLVADAGITQYGSWNGTNSASLDRLNIMTYDFAYTGDPYSWFGSAIYGPTPTAVWSMDLARTRFMASGVPVGKMNLGIRLYGFTTLGGSPVIYGPRQSYGAKPPAMTEIAWHTIIESYDVSNPNRDTASGGAPWITIPNGWLSLSDPTYIARIVQYAISTGFGGFFCWNLESDYISTGSTSAQKHPLLSATGGTL